ncbi:MAG: hypothetical protein QNJ98_06170 [Planctomycetota bacterium]|nr:hypothetical protein [Planctomycetota bacterium]
MSIDTQDDRLLAELVAASSFGLDANTVAAGVGGETHRPEVAALARDPEAAFLLRVLGHARARRRRRIVLGIGAVAAALVVALVVLVSKEPEVRPAAERLSASLAALEADQPALFAGVTAEVSVPSAGSARGGAVWRGPRGTVLASPSVLSWTAPPGARRMQVRLQGPGVDLSRTVSTSTLELPDLGPGRYVATLRALDGFARQSVRRSFVVASAQERERYTRAREAIAAAVDDDLVDLVEARFAIANGFLEAARDAARRAATQPGEIGALARKLEAALDGGD